GYTSNNVEQFYYADFRGIADTADFLIVLPNGTLDGLGQRYWNCFATDGSGVDDIAFLNALTDTLQSLYNIDVNRIYSTGMSNGGFMSYALAGELSSRIAAIASVAGSVSKDRMPSMNRLYAMP